MDENQKQNAAYTNKQSFFARWRGLHPNTKSFLKRAALFLSIYIVFGYFQPWISNRLYGISITINDPYLVYMIFPVFALFAILRWEKIKQTDFGKIGWRNAAASAIFLALSVLCLLAPIKGLQDRLIQNQNLTTLTSAVIFLASCFFLLLTIFGWSFLKRFREEILSVIIVYTVYMCLSFVFTNHWPRFFKLIAYPLQTILSLFTNEAHFSPNSQNIALRGFSIGVGPPCSGIFSLITFGVLFVTALFLFKKKNGEIRYFLSGMAFIAGLAAAFALNIIRITIIILVGGFYSEKLAINLFHEFLAPVFLIALYIVYIHKIIPRLLKQDMIQ